MFCKMIYLLVLVLSNCMISSVQSMDVKESKVFFNRRIYNKVVAYLCRVFNSICLQTAQLAVADDPDTIDDDSELIPWVGELEISPNIVGSVPYKNFRINVYEHTSTQTTSLKSAPKKFFYSPISLLEPSSATSTFNIVTSQAEMKFHIEMWNDYVQQLVVDWIKREIDPTVRESLVQVIPFDKILLVQSSAQQLYRISNEWTPYQLQKDVHFTLNCHFIRDCDQLALQMRQNAKHFSSFRLLFSASSQKTKTKEIKIQVESILSGRMASKLIQRMPNVDFALLTADDEKELLAESSTAVLIDSIDNSDSIVLSDSETEIYKFLKEALIDPSRIFITNQSDHMWESVFWDDENYRPDKTTVTWNEIYKAMDKDSRKVLTDSFNIRIKDLINFSKIKLGSFEYGHSGSLLTEMLEKLYEKSCETVRWDGDKFVPKPLSLSRINLAKIKNSQTFEDCNLRVSYSIAVLSVSINIPQHDDDRA